MLKLKMDVQSEIHFVHFMILWLNIVNQPSVQLEKIIGKFERTGSVANLRHHWLYTLIKFNWHKNWNLPFIWAAVYSSVGWINKDKPMKIIRQKSSLLMKPIFLLLDYLISRIVPFGVRNIQGRLLKSHYINRWSLFDVH